MSWIQENKFIVGLAGVTAVIGGAILYFGNSQGSAYEEKMLEYDELKTQHSRLVKAKPYPNQENLKARQAGIKEYEDVIADVRKALASYQPGKLPVLTPQEFSDAQVKMQAELTKAFADAGTTLPEKCAFGFEKYATIQAKAKATARLNFELGAMQWLFTRLAGTKPVALLNVRRGLLDVETGAAPEEPARRPGKRMRGRGKPAQGEKPYVLMPVELAFTTTEAGLREFLKEMANSKDYYYAVRAIRIRSERQTAPTVKEADFASSGGGGSAAPNDPFGLSLPDTDGGGEGQPAVKEPVKPSAGSGERILKQVLGSEKLNVYISFDILLLKGKGKEVDTDVPAASGS